MQSVPCEYLELYFPLVIEKYELVEDSGGAGASVLFKERTFELVSQFDGKDSTVGGMVFVYITVS